MSDHSEPQQLEKKRQMRFVATSRLSIKAHTPGPVMKLVRYKHTPPAVGTEYTVKKRRRQKMLPNLTAFLVSFRHPAFVWSESGEPPMSAAALWFLGCVFEFDDGELLQLLLRLFRSAHEALRHTRTFSMKTNDQLQNKFDGCSK